MKRSFLILAFASLAIVLNAQTRIVALGSSTTLGSAASPSDSAWVARLQAFYRKNTSVSDPDTIIYKIGYYGYTTYKELPTGFVAPILRATIDEANNVTEAMEYNPDIVIINLPSNDVSSYAWPYITPAYNIKETMDNYRTMYNYVTNAGVKCFVTTTQPRNDLSVSQRQLQKDLADSIIKTFGAFAINFWDDLVVPDGSNLLKDEVRHLGYSDQDYHLNNVGHRYLFERVKAKNIFEFTTPLPLILKDFHLQLANNSVLIKWATSFTIQRSVNGTDFRDLHSENSQGQDEDAEYTWTDENPSEGKNFYRLKIIETSKIRYSKVLSVTFRTNQITIEKLYWNSSTLSLQMSSKVNQVALISVVHSSGATIFRQQVRLNTLNNRLAIPISGWSAGEYLISIATPDGTIETRKLAKIN